MKDSKCDKSKLRVCERGIIADMMKKIAVMGAIVLVCALVLAGCGGSAEIAKPAMKEGATPFTAEGSCEAALNGSVLTVSGTSNLMDGTNGIISVLSADGTTVADNKFTKSGDAISHDFAIDEDWPEVVYGFISFDTQQADSQPKEVTEVYGKKFENIEGDSKNVIWDMKGVIVVFQSEAITIG